MLYLPGHAWSIHDRVGHKWWKGRASSKSKPKLFQINISALASELAQPLLVVLASPGCTLHSRKCCPSPFEAYTYGRYSACAQ